MTASPPPSAYVLKAGDYKSVGRLDDAGRTLGDGLQAYPGHPTLMAEMALVQLDRGDTASALSMARAAVATHPEGVYENTALARVLMKVGRFEEAVDASGRAAAADSGAASAVFVHALALIEVDRHNDAAVVADELIVQHPASHLGHIAHVQSALHRTRFLTIQPVLFVVIAIVTSGFSLLVHGVRWLFHRIRNAALLARIDKHMAAALEIAPGDPFVLELAADVLDVKGQWVGGLDRRVGAARIDLAGADIDGLTQMSRSRMGKSESLAVALVTLVSLVIVSILGRWGLVPVGVLVVGGVVWAADRRRRVARILPTGLHRDVFGAWQAWIGPCLAVIMALWVLNVSLSA